MGKINSSPVRSEIIEFLEISAAGRPPCDRANYIEGWTPLDSSSLPTSELRRDGEEEEVGPPTIVPGLDDTGGVGSVHVKHGGGVQRVLSNPLSFTMGSEIRKACYTLSNMCDPKGKLNGDRSVPLDLLRGAKGVAFLSVIKGGVIISARVGTGLVLARAPDGGWSAPSAIGTVGVGWGAQVGGDITTYMIVLTTDDAVKSFGGGSRVSLGTELDVAVGPVGRSVEGKVGAGGGVWASPAYSYAHSKGLFVGISLEGAVVKARNDVNAKFYGRPIAVKEILGGGVGRPRAAEGLYRAMGEAERADIKGWRPSVALRESGLVRGNGGNNVVGTMTGGWPAQTTTEQTGNLYGT